jgi:hypothetical protein
MALTGSGADMEPLLPLCQVLIRILWMVLPHTYVTGIAPPPVYHITHINGPVDGSMGAPRVGARPQPIPLSAINTMQHK